MKSIYNKKGITLMALIATIVVSLLLMTTVVISYSSFSTGAKKKAFANEISTVQSAIEDYKFRNGEYPIKAKVEIPISNCSAGLIETFRSNSEQEYFNNSKVELYTIDFSKTDIEKLSRGLSRNIDNLDMYAYSLNTNSLYYLQGESIGDKTYYTYDEELYKLLKGIK